MNSNEIIEKTKQAIKESNKILIQELIKDLEEKGLKPVIAIDGQVKKLKLVIASELEDFYQAVDNHQANRHDFCLLEVDKTKGGNGIYTIEGNVIVVCKTSGKLKEYAAGDASSWVAEFENDLKNKFFL